jgi:hypothetical protein
VRGWGGIGRAPSGSQRGILTSRSLPRLMEPPDEGPDLDPGGASTHPSAPLAPAMMRRRPRRFCARDLLSGRRDELRFASQIPAHGLVGRIAVHLSGRRDVPASLRSSEIPAHGLVGRIADGLSGRRDVPASLRSSEIPAHGLVGRIADGLSGRRDVPASRCSSEIPAHGLVGRIAVHLSGRRDVPASRCSSEIPAHGLVGRIAVHLSGRRDSNPGPSAPKADALPDCATPRHKGLVTARGFSSLPPPLRQPQEKGTAGQAAPVPSPLPSPWVHRPSHASDAPPRRVASHSSHGQSARRVSKA